MPHLWCGLNAVLLFAAAAPAAKTPPAPAPVYSGTKLEQGQKAFADGQLDLALKALDAAAAENPDPVTMEKVQLLRGQCLAARGDFGRAEEAFALALEANPEASLDPGRVDPAVVKLLEAMRARSTGILTFRSTPEGAHVSIDGNDQGPAPLTIIAGIGRHRLSARWGDDREAQAEVMVRAKRETYVEWVLREKIVEKKVEKIVEVQVKPPVDPEPRRWWHPFGAVRGSVDVNAGPEGGIDFGGGMDFKYFSAGVYFRPYRYLYVIPRLTGIWPVFEFLSLFAALEVSLRTIPGRFGVALGGALGGEYFIKSWLTAFGEVGGKGFFINETFVHDGHFTLAAGLKARLP